MDGVGEADRADEQADDPSADGSARARAAPDGSEPGPCGKRRGGIGRRPGIGGRRPHRRRVADDTGRVEVARFPRESGSAGRRSTAKRRRAPAPVRRKLDIHDGGHGIQPCQQGEARPAGCGERLPCWPDLRERRCSLRPSRRRSQAACRPASAVVPERRTECGEAAADADDARDPRCAGRVDAMPAADDGIARPGLEHPLIAGSRRAARHSGGRTARGRTRCGRGRRHRRRCRPAAPRPRRGRRRQRNASPRR